MPEIDCRGKACPEPVVIARKTLNELTEDGFTMIVNDASSCENVERFVRSQGASVVMEKKGPDFYLHVEKGKAGPGVHPKESEKTGKVMVYVNSALLGEGDEDLGSFLMNAFLKTLLDLEKKPERVVLVNSGVKLASETSRALETLQVLSEKGVRILCCGTCLDYYELKGKTRVGTITNMYDIIQSMLEADRVLRP